MRWSVFVRLAIEGKAHQGADLLAALAEAAETQDERDVIEYADGVDSAFTDLPDAPVVPLIRFDWIGGAFSSVVGLDLVDGGDCGLLTLWDDDSGNDLEVIARIPLPPDSVALVAALSRIDPTVVVSPFASAPDTITIHEPTLLSEDAVHAWLRGELR